MELPSLRPGSWIGFDYETTTLFNDDGATVVAASIAWHCDDYLGGRSHSLFDFCPSDGIHSLAFAFDMGDLGKPWEKAQMDLFGGAEEANLDRRDWDQLHDWIRDDELQLTGHNIIGFDALVSEAGIGTYGDVAWRDSGRSIVDRIGWDTFIANREIYPGQSLGLKPTAERLWGAEERYAEKDLKDWIRRNKRHWVKLGYPQDWAGYDLVPWDIMEKYAAVDAELALRLRDAQVAELAGGNGVLTNILEDFETAFLLADMERKGLPYDQKGSRAAAIEVQSRMRKIEIPFQPTDPAARKYFGVTSLTADVLVDLVAREGHGSAAERWSRYKKLQTADKMWYTGYADKVGPDGRLRTRFRQLGTRTGRLSCERVNLQATPADYRMQHEDLAGVATPKGLIKSAIPEGMALVQMDAAQAELRTACMVVANRRMAALIAKGLDAHGETAKSLFGIDESHPTWKARRQLAKRSNFSLINGVGWATFRDTIHKEEGVWMPESEVKEIVHGWNRLYPQHKKEIYRAMNQADQDKYVRLANGRFRWFTPIEDHYKAHGNAVQGSIGFFTLDWLRACDDICKEYGIVEGGAGVVLSVHDSVYLLVPARDAEHLSEKCAEAFDRIWFEYFDPTENGGWSKIWVPGHCDIDIDYYAKAS